MLECLRWSKSVWDDEETHETIANCFKRAGFQKELCDSQSSTEIVDNRYESLKTLFDHLSDLQFIGPDDSNLLDDFTSADEELETTPVFERI